MINGKCKNKDVTALATALRRSDKSDSWQSLGNAVQRYWRNERLARMTDNTWRTSCLHHLKKVTFLNCEAPQFHLYFGCMMTILQPHGSLRSHNSLSNFNMSTQLSNAWPQRKNSAMCSSLWPWDKRGVNVNMGAAQHCQSWRPEQPSAQMFTWQRDARCCKKDLMLIMGVRRKNAHLTVNRASRPCERARPAGTSSAHSVIQSFLTEIKKGNNVQRSMAQQSGFGRIWQFTGGEKKEWKAGKSFSCFDGRFLWSCMGRYL